MADVLSPPPPDNKPANRGLWILVIGLGIAILVVVAAMIGMAIRNVVYKKPVAAAPTITTIPGDVPELALDLPAGATVAETHIEAGNLLVRVTTPTGDEIFIIDPHAAKVVARIKLNKPAAGAPTP
ncbi:MAG: hypothetical protein GC190_03235 [Alphaproteobacteria bacterium]|nr:hypothetical protein [Alphaproteobacteria bacterium]